MAANAAVRFSLLQPASVDQDFTHTTPLRRPRSARANPTAPGSSPRSFSLYYPSQTEDFFASFSSKRRSVIKTPSLASLNMAFGFRSEKSSEKEKSKQVERAKEKVQRPRTASEWQRADSSLRTLQTTSIDARPSSPHGRFNLQVPSMRGLKKKRSLASVLPVANEISSTTNDPQPSGSRPKLTNDSTLLTAPLRDPDLDVDTVSKARSWSKRHNMKTRSNQFNAPYMQAYDPILLDNDRHVDLLLRRLNPLDGPSFLNYDQAPPSSVLDLGCGAGQWILSAANAWSQTKFTGFDLVDVLIEDAHVHDNISLVNGDFLQFPWPFENGSFDFIRMSNLSICVPFNQWESVLLEAHRVLQINGRIELVDDEIFFPYAPVPSCSRRTSTPGSASPPSIPTPTQRPNDISFLDIDTDDDTLEGEESDDDDDYGTTSSESTLTSERDFPFSLNGNGPSQLAVRNSHYQKRSSLHRSSDDHDIARTPTSPGRPPTPTSTSTAIDNPDKTDLSSLGATVAASRDLETVFKNMLKFKYGIYLRPAELLPEALQGIFGNADEIGNFQLKLAPVEAIKCIPSLMEVTGEKEERHVEIRTVGKKINDITKSLEGRLAMRKANKALTHPVDLPPLDTQFLLVDSHIPDGLSAKAAGRLGIAEDPPSTDSRFSDKISAKAASRLGISVPGDMRRSDEMVLSPVVETAGESEYGSDAESVTRTPTPGNFMPAIAGHRSNDGHGSSGEMISAKAAHRLGISYSALTQAAKASRRPLSSSSTLVSSSGISTMVQSPGLIVDSTSEFIPFNPSELEMHVCKNIHMLIGCKPALLDFNATFVGENGRLLQTKEEFDDALWEYECFRRRRFNWPSECPAWEIDSTEVDDTTSPVSSQKATTTPKIPSLHYRKSSDRSSPDVPAASTLSGDAFKPNLTPALNELTHVRTIRVYQTVKTSERPITKASVLRPLPPIPPSSPLIASQFSPAPRIQMSNTI